MINEYVQKKGWAWSDFMVISFNHYELQDIMLHCPAVTTGAIIVGLPIGLAEFGTRAHAQTVICDSVFVNQAIVDDAHARGMKIYIFTVNTPDEMIRIKKLGVDGIISNYPDVALTTLSEPITS